MRLEYLHYLLVIDAHHSISAAARELYISQTALSSIVSRVEEELGFPIFLRSREGVTPTEEGKEALAIAWDIWSGWTASLSIGQQKEGAPVAVHIIGSPSVNNSLALPLIRSYYQVEQRGNLIFHEVIGSDVGPSILNKKANIGLTYYNKKNLKEFLSVSQKYQIQVSRLYRDHLYLIVREDHPLAQRDVVEVSELKNQHFAVLPHFSTVDNAIFFTRLMDPSNRFTTFPNVPLVKRAILDSGIMGVLSWFSFCHDGCRGTPRLRAIPFPGLAASNDMPLYLIHQKVSSLHHQEQVALDCIRKYFAALPPPAFEPSALSQPRS